MQKKKKQQISSRRKGALIGKDTDKKTGKGGESVVLKNYPFVEEKCNCTRQFVVVNIKGPAESFFYVITRSRNQN